MPLPDWFLSTEERGNPSTSIPTWSAGNTAEPLIHGKGYFARLAAEVETLSDGDHLFFTDWRGDSDQRLTEEGDEIADVLCDLAGAGIEDHVHLHVVPRWNGDTSFMPVLADVKVLPEALERTAERLRPHFA